MCSHNYQVNIMTTDRWEKLGEGENNNVYKKLDPDESGTFYVLKIPKTRDKLSAPRRVSNKWNQANPDLPATALNGPHIYWDIETSPKNENKIKPDSVFLYTKNNRLKAILKHKNGEIEKRDLTHISTAKAIIELIDDEAYCLSSLKQEHQIRQALNVPYRGILAPFVEGNTDLSEEQQAEALIELYVRTGQIVIDYDVEGNLISEFKTGKVRCIDFDEVLSLDSPKSRMRFFAPRALNPYDAFLDSYVKPLIHAGRDIKLGTQINATLLYLEKHLEDYLSPRDILKKYITREMIFALRVFERSAIPITIRTLEILSFLMETHPEHQLYLLPQSIDVLAANANCIEDICQTLYEMLQVLPREKYLELSQPAALALFIQDKQAGLQATV